MVATSDAATTTSVLALMGAAGLWVVSILYLRVQQMYATKATKARRIKENPMGLPHKERNFGYSFNYANPREGLQDMPPHMHRAYNVVLSQAENFPFFGVVIVAHIALRGTLNGSTEVALLSMIHLVCRGASAVTYIMGYSVLRAMSYYFGLLCLVGMYILLFESLGIADDGPGGDDDDVGV